MIRNDGKVTFVGWLLVIAMHASILYITFLMMGNL
jgi:hypothetical protein